MKIREIEFAGAVARPGGRTPTDLPQVAFSGRSNVGKSSLINRLLGRNRTPVARVSGTPGKTQEINFYRVSAKVDGGGNVEFLLVDLPGYGYARVPLEVRAKWKPLIEAYLSGTRELRGVVQLLDARHAPSAEDSRMVDYLASSQVPTLFVLTKIDKLGRSRRDARVRETADALGVEIDQILPFSSKTGEGREDLLASLEGLLLKGAAA